MSPNFPNIIELTPAIEQNIIFIYTGLKSGYLVSEKCALFKFEKLIKSIFTKNIATKKNHKNLNQNKSYNI